MVAREGSVHCESFFANERIYQSPTMLQIVQDQIHRDDKVKDLFLQMASLYEIVENLRLQLEDGGIKSSTELLSRISKQTVNCCYFIRDYASPGLSKRPLYLLATHRTYSQSQ